MNNSNILFLSCAYSNDKKDQYLSHSKRGYQYAAQNFQEALLSGFIQNKAELTVLSIPALSTFPIGFSRPFVKDVEFNFNGISLGRSYGFCNVPLLNSVYQKRIDRSIDNWYENTKGDKCILVYALIKNQMKYAVAAKRRHSDINLCIIVPDLPDYMACNKYYKLLGFQKRDKAEIDSLIQQFDKYIVLAEPMVDSLGISSKPYLVVEGIYNEVNSNKIPIEACERKRIMYAGGIHSRYGVFDLIEAFHRIDDDTFQLLLCGGCPEMDRLNHYLEIDKRIKYLGLIPTEELRSIQKRVTLLINPRHSAEEFTKYSFPSKTLEYMASGTPVLMSSLPSIPKEYYDYLYFFGDESIEGMKSRIIEVCNIDPELLAKKGTEARGFVIKEKSAINQTNKILCFID